MDFGDEVEFTIENVSFYRHLNLIFLRDPSPV